MTCEIEIDGKNVSVKIPPLEVNDLSGISKYLNANLETAIAELVSQMIRDEIKASASVGKKRNDILSEIRNKAEKKVRVRVNESENFILPKEIREMKKEKHPLLKMDFESLRLLRNDLPAFGEKYLENKRKDVFEFMDKFMKAHKDLNGKTPNKTNIAKLMFKENVNSHLALKRELEKIGFTFEEILSEIPK